MDARKNVVPEVGMIQIDQINEAYERLERSDALRLRDRHVVAHPAAARMNVSGCSSQPEPASLR